MDGMDCCLTFGLIVDEEKRANTEKRIRDVLDREARRDCKEDGTSMVLLAL